MNTTAQAMPEPQLHLPNELQRIVAKHVADARARSDFVSVADIADAVVAGFVANPDSYPVMLWAARSAVCRVAYEIINGVPLGGHH